MESGQGNLLYPGPEGRLLPSIRLENLRDGNEDYEYLTFLEGLLAEARSGTRKISEALQVRGEALLAIPADVVISTGEYSRDASRLSALREAVADLIEEILR